MTCSLRSQWFIILQAWGYTDVANVKRSLAMLQKHLHPRTGVHILWFGPRDTSPASVYYLTQNAMELIHQCNATDPVKTQIYHCLEAINEKQFDRILFWGHGAGWALGQWKRKEPFLSIENLDRYIFRRLKPKLVVFDSCMMGAMACLYALKTKSVRYCVASPGLHPYFSFLDMSLFASIGPRSSLKQYAIQLANEWQTKSKHVGDSVRCMSVFDVKQIQSKVAPLIKKYWPNLQFDKRAQIHNEHARFFDVWTAARQFPDLQRAIQKSVLNHKQICRQCTRVRGPSTDSKRSQKWQEVYARSSWARYLGSDHEKHHTLPQRNYEAPSFVSQHVPSNLRKMRKR